MTKKKPDAAPNAALELLTQHGGRRFSTILADPPWQFQNRTGKVAPEHKRLSRYGTMELEDIMALPERTRDVFLLHRFEEMTYSDISQHFGISLSAVEKHMIKALRLLSRAATDR